MSNPITEESLYQMTSQELTQLLYDALDKNLLRAIEAIQMSRFEEANQALQRSNDILHRLGVGINYEAGIIADQLEHLYNYMAERLVQANLQKDVELIAEVRQLIGMISEAWRDAKGKQQSQQPAQNALKRRITAYEQDLYEPDRNVDRKD